MKRFSIFVAVFLILVSSPVVRAEATDPLTDEYIAAIREGCSDALRGILQVQKSEAVTRVNRGREYESTLRLMVALNTRIVANKLDAPVLTSASSRLQSRFSDFQEHYLEYADKMDATLAINCKQAPVSFYDSLTGARAARAVVAEDIKKLEVVLDEYQAGLDTFRATISQREQGGES